MDGDKTVTATFTEDEYIITATADANGSINPSGDIVKTYGQDQQFTAVPNAVYMVDTWYLDDDEVQSGGASYTLTNIQTNHTVHVTFERLAWDDFEDTRRKITWQAFADNNDKTWVVEDGNQLNVRAVEATALDQFIVGHWPMNDNDDQTQVDDISGNNNHGTAQQITSALHTDSGNPPELNGALTFNGTSDYIDLGAVIGTGAYTKAAWVKIDGGSYMNNIVSSDTLSHAIFAPSAWGFKLTAGHNDTNPAYNYNHVQDNVGLEADTWYHVAVTFDPAVDSGRMVLYKDGLPIDTATNVPTQPASTTYIGKFYTGNWLKGSIDNVMVFETALTADDIELLYNEGNGTETIPDALHYANYAANDWLFDVNEDFEVKVDFHYSGISGRDGWVGMTIEIDPNNYVSISAGSDSGQPYFYYEKVVDGSAVLEQLARAANDGTLYISYDTSADELYLSTTGYGAANAWQTAAGLLQAQWASEPVGLSIGGGSDGVALDPGEAYLDNYETTKAKLIGWPPATDLNSDGFIDWLDIAEMRANWLYTGANPECDLNNDEIVNFLDFEEFASIW